MGKRKKKEPEEDSTDVTNPITATQVTPAGLALMLGNGRWLEAGHLKLLDSLLVLSVSDQPGSELFRRLIVNMPPRHGKSELVSKLFPFWFLGKFPSKSIILTSYEAKFAASWGGKVRNLIKEHGKPVFDIELDKSSRAADSFIIAIHEGGMSCAGAGGAITGKGADLLIIDDPIKNSAEANSQKIRDNIWDWFVSTAYTRLEPNGAIVIIMTRWHEDDLCGRITGNFTCDSDFSAIQGIEFNNTLNSDKSSYIENPDKSDNNQFKQNQANQENNANQGSDIWKLVSFPAIALGEDSLGRKEGDPLWPERFPLPKLVKIRQTLGSYWFSALYQQHPSPASGGYFRRSNFKYFTEDDVHYYLKNTSTDSQPSAISRISAQIAVAKSDCSVYATVDLAARSTETSDYTVVLLFAVTPKKDILILETIREKFEPTEHIKILNTVFDRFRPLVIGIESVQYQYSLVQAAQNIGLPVKDLRADRDKVTRALPMAARLESGKVYFRLDAAWLATFEDELLKFPNARYDDQVDAFAYIAAMIEPISKSSPAGAVRERVFGKKFIEKYY